ncbi:MAG: hypothetical protein GF344_08770 [Chitinivibrionales bacterium]|nr:hypothetical protein [Chitinivibrionales bacterium]
MKIGYLLCTAGMIALAARGVMGSAFMEARVDPEVISAGRETPITVSISVADSELAADSLAVYEVTSSGCAATPFLTLYDNGEEGDAVAGDNTFTGTAVVNKPYSTTVTIRVIGYFHGIMKPIQSQDFAYTVEDR